MTKTAKKQSYKIIVYLPVFFLLYISLPVYLFLHPTPFLLKLAYLAYFSNIALLCYSFHRIIRQKRSFQLQAQDLQEKINIANDEKNKLAKNQISLQEKISRYHSLKKIIEEINQDLSLEAIADNLSSIAFSLIGDHKGVCVLYLVDPQTQANLSLFKAKKENHHLIIKAKEGDVFDFWVLKHATPLFIEDVHKDFRFDLEKLKSQDVRPVSSLISSPLVSNSRFLGLLRLDHTEAGFYSQDDLRFLVTICDLGSVALENGELFQRTQNLALHDELTCLFTKGYFLQRLKEECQRAMRHNRILSLFMFDIDYFKNYNDKFGHTAGDQVLKTLSQKIFAFFRDYSAVIGRFGGEEFCVALPDTEKKKAGLLAEELRRNIEKTKIILRRQETNVTVSIGVVSLPQDASDENEIILKADKAMYEAKQKGRNRVCLA